MDTAYTDAGLTVSKVRKDYMVPAIVEAVRLAREKWPDKQFTVNASESASTVEVRIAWPMSWAISA